MADQPAISASGTDHLERILDQAVADSLPASDPVSLSMPHDPVADFGLPRKTIDPTTAALVGFSVVGALIGIALLMRR